MQTKLLARILAAIILIAIVTLTTFFVSTIRTVAGATPVLVENFKNNTFNSTMWKIVHVGGGPTATVVNERLQITLPANSTSDPLAGGFSANLVSLCHVSGDFDMQVGFRLQTWPPNNGVRTGLGLVGTPSVVERISESTAGELYLTNFLDGIQGIKSANDLSGFLRLTRTGSNATGYYLSGTTWVALHSGPVTSADSLFQFAAWSDDTSFSHTTVQMSFGNFTMSSGQLVCSEPSDESPTASFSISPTRTAPGQTVSVDGSASTDPDGKIVYYFWSFGDNSVGTGPYTSHVYNSPGNYTVRLTVTDSDGQNGTAVHSVSIIAPTITASPSSGPVGTKMTIHGSNFPVSSGPYAFPITIDVTFDDQFVGFETITTSSFDFVLNVPVSQPGLHQIHAYAQTYPSPIETTTNFTVTTEPTNVLSVTITSASIYFPGDTAVVYVLSTIGGSPTRAQSIRLMLLPPTGPAISLNLVSMSPGLYRATYTIPSTGPIGTYALVASSQANRTNSTALASFEVKPTWLSSNSGRVVTAAGIVGAIGTVSFLGVAWKRGYFAKKKEEFPES